MKKIALKKLSFTNKNIQDKFLDYRQSLLDIASSGGAQGIATIQELEQRLKIRTQLKAAPEEPELGHEFPIVEFEDADLEALRGWMRANWRPVHADEAFLEFMTDVLGK